LSIINSLLCSVLDLSVIRKASETKDTMDVDEDDDLYQPEEPNVPAEHAAVKEQGATSGGNHADDLEEGEEEDEGADMEEDDDEDSVSQFAPAPRKN
jgi:hypothetical protein